VPARSFIAARVESPGISPSSRLAWGSRKCCTAGRAAFASLEEGLQRGLADLDVGALLKLREEPVGVQVRLPRS